MKLASLEIFQFQISLIKPLNISGQIYSSRRGLVIRLTDDHGHFGVSEIAPLPGWHQENIQEACHQLKEEAPRFLKAFPLQSDGKDKFISVIRNEWDNFYPSVRWGMEIALLQLRANQNSCHLYHLSNESYQPFIHINALLTGKNHEILHNASDRLAEGYPTLKVKVGRSPIDKEIKLIKELRDSIGPEPKIRLDANQSWNFSQAISFLRAVKDVGIEYIEEPVQEIKDLSKLQQDSDIVLALDESLYGQYPDKIQLPPNVKYLILKPTRMGGMKRVFDWIGLARTKKLGIVISSTFESGITISVLSQLSGMLRPDNLAMGLDTLRWLKKDLLQEDIMIQQGQIDIQKIAAVGQKINWDMLQFIKKIQL